MKTNKLFMLGTFGLIAALATTACVIEDKKDDEKGNNGGSGGSGGDGGSGDDAGPDGSDEGDAGPDGSGGSDGGDENPLPDDYMETCGEDDANNSKDTAIPFGAKAKLCLPEGDIDWMKVVTPDDGKAHLIELSFEQQADARFRMDAIADVDNTTIDTYWSDKGTKKTIFLTVGPNTTTYLKFEPYGEYGYVDFTLKLTAENDEHEPNNERTKAAPVNLNEDIKGQLWTPYVSENDQVSDDWFKADLAVGTATLKIAHAPENQRYAVEVFDKNNVSVDTLWMDALGSISEQEIEIETAGTHYFKLRDYGSDHLDGIITVTKPKSLTEQYTFRIEQ